MPITRLNPLISQLNSRIISRLKFSAVHLLRCAGWAGTIATLVTSTVFILAITGPLSHPSSAQLRDRLTPPGGVGKSGTKYLLGTDALGRDLLSRVISGCRVSVIVGVLGVFVSSLIGIPLGLFAGYRGGLFDSFCSRLADVQLSIPFLLMAIALMASVGQGLIQVIVVLGVARWAVFFRITRSEVISTRNEEYIMAARAIGANQLHIIARHVLPNVLPPIIVTASLGVGDAILAEAGLSYLGLGVPSDMPSWGLITREGKDYLQIAWWIATIPGLAISLLVLSINILGDRLRDYMNPSFRRIPGARYKREAQE